MRVPGSFLNRPDPLQAIWAWVCFSGTSGAIYGSFGVTSVTRNATGDYTLTFEQALAATPYTVMGLGRNDDAATVGYPAMKGATLQTTTSCTMTTHNGAGTVADNKVVTLMIQGTV